MGYDPPVSELETAARVVPRVVNAMVLVLALLGHACGEPAQDTSRELRVRAEPHLRAFETFDAWARRSLDADLALRDVRALDETVFAPIRRQPRIVAAWVEREGADPRSLGLRAASLPTLDWVELRGVPMLPRLEAADTQLPDARVPRSPPVHVLVLSRKADSARGGGDVRVTIAFEAQAE
jgi:hypothetical protein